MVRAIGGLKMNKPEMLYTVTVGQTRNKYRLNSEALDNTLNLVLTGIWADVANDVGEYVLNRVLTEILVQQEYIRELEKMNYGW